MQGYSVTVNQMKFIVRRYTKDFGYLTSASYGY